MLTGPWPGFFEQINCLEDLRFPRLGLSYRFSDKYAESSLAVWYRNANLDFRDVPFEVPHHQ